MDKPRLRPVQAVPIEYKGRPCVQIFDPTRLSDKPMVMSREALYILTMFDGTSTVRDIQAELIRRTGQLVLSDDIRGIIEQLDEALLLDSERFRVHVRELAAAYRRAPARRATGAGSAYPADPAALKAQLDGYFAAELPDGLEAGANASGRLVGIVSPHIDFDRGGPSYAHAYAPLAREAAEADLFVVLGTAHFAEGSLFIPTAKSYETPFGTLATNEELVHELARRGGGDALFAEELVHASEHSIEFQAVLLKHIFGDRPVEMLPILCGALETHVPDGQSPREVAEVSDFLDALAEVTRGSGRTVCTIAGADLSHVGRFFGDDFPLTPQLMGDVERADRESLGFVERLDADGLYEQIQADDNARHVCGVPPLYALLATTEASRCELLDYRQAVNTEEECAVTFASLALYA